MVRDVRIVRHEFIKSRDVHHQVAIFHTLVNVPLLIIDDFGLKPLRPPEDETFHDLMAERYERAATVLTSNLDFGEWGEGLPRQQTAGNRHPGSTAAWRLSPHPRR